MLGILEESEKKETTLQQQMRTLRQETREQFEVVLNEEQLEQLNKMRDNRWEEKGKRH